MRLAVLSDIHGNLDALEAVLQDLDAVGQVDHIWCLGDLAAFGPNPSECIQRIHAVPDIKIIRGNTDRYLIYGSRPGHPKATEEHWDSIVERTRTRDENFLWTLARLSWDDMEKLQNLASELALEMEGYGWVVGFHAVPGNDEERLLPNATEHDIRDALLDREGSLAFGGHTHRAMDRDVGTWRFVNPGSVGFPFDGDQRAAYAIATFKGGEVEMDLRRVAYDVDAVIAKYDDHPAREMMIRRLQTAQE